MLLFKYQFFWCTLIHLNFLRGEVDMNENAVFSRHEKDRQLSQGELASLRRSFENRPRMEDTEPTNVKTAEDVPSNLSG